MSADQPIRRTKIVATLGPAWDSVERMHALFDAGVNIVRINASHGSSDDARGVDPAHPGCPNRRAAFPPASWWTCTAPASGSASSPSRSPSPRGSRCVFAPEATAQEGDIPTTYPELAGDVVLGSRILLDDGLLAVDVTAVRGDRVEGRVRYGGLLKANKGMNLPGVDVSAPAVTDTDREEVLRVIALGVDYIGVSFVRRAEDIEELRAIVPKTVRLIAKIEKDTALNNLDEILEASDAVMVARGDLGVELPFEQVPLVQKRIISRANRHGKPVITATQMLESMITNPRPTRAEASDVANAILDGTDAVMLSAETAVGSYGLEAVLAMDRIAREVEAQRLRPPEGERRRWSLPPRTSRAPRLARRRPKTPSPWPSRRPRSCCRRAAIVCFTSSGFTARTVSSYRPQVPILALTAEPETYHQLGAGVGRGAGADAAPQRTTSRCGRSARAELLARGLAREGSRVVVTCGVPFDVPGTTNLLKVETV